MSEHIKKQFAERANQLSTAPTGARHWEICSHHNSVQTVITFLANTYKSEVRFTACDCLLISSGPLKTIFL